MFGGVKYVNKCIPFKTFYCISNLVKLKKDSYFKKLEVAWTDQFKRKIGILLETELLFLLDKRDLQSYLFMVEIQSGKAWIKSMDLLEKWCWLQRERRKEGGMLRNKTASEIFSEAEVSPDNTMKKRILRDEAHI